MDSREYIINLYEYYKNLLTDKQRKYFEDYYFDNLTMEEIAENDSISKNAVSKQLINIKEKLDYYENNLKLYDNKKNIENILKDTSFLEKVSKYI